MGLFLPLLGIARVGHNRRNKRFAPPALVLLGMLTLTTLSARASTLPVAIAPAPTSFSSQAVGVAQTAATVTFNVTTGGEIDTPLVLTSGSANQDYTLSSTTCSGSSVSTGTCTVSVVFKPRLPGQRLGAVVLTSGGTTVATALLYGTGTGPAVIFPANATTTTLSNSFVNPFSLAVDGAGDVFVADSNGNNIYEIKAVGGSIPASPTVVPLSPKNTTAPRGLALDGAGNLYFGDNGSVKEILEVNGSIPTAATPLVLNSNYSAARGIAVDALGNVFVADSNNSTVTELKAAANGAVAVPTTATSLPGSYSSPGGVAVDSAYNVYVADYNNHVVKKLMYSSGTYATPTTLGTSLGANAYPNALALDAAGNIYVANAGQGAGYDNGSVVELLAGSSYSQVTLASYNTTVKGVALDGTGNVYVADLTATTTTTPAVHAVKEITQTSPPSLSFATTAVGSTSSDSPKSVTLTNLGNGALTFANPASGSNPSVSAGFTYGNSSSCSPTTPNSSAYTLASNASCTEAVSYTPVVTGNPVTGTMTSTDNNLGVTGSTQVVQLSGATPTSDAFTVTGVSPSTGFTTGGTVVTITGTGFGSANKVYFGTVAAAINTQSSTQITATSPAQSAAGVVDITVGSTTTGDFSVPTTADQFTYIVRALAGLTVTGYPTFAPSGVAQTVTVTAYDNSGSVYTTYTATPTVTTTDPLATVQFSNSANGVFTYSVTLKTAGTQTIAATDSVHHTVTGLETGVVSTGYVVAVSPDNTPNPTLSKFTENGAAFNSSGYTATGARFGAAVDAAGDVFTASSSNTLLGFNSAGTALSGSPYSGGGLSTPQQLAVDGAGQVWIVNSGNNSLSVFTNSGTPVSPSGTGYISGVPMVSGAYNNPTSVAIDISGNVWVSNAGGNNVVEVLGAAAPTAPPSTALTNGTTGARP